MGLVFVVVGVLVSGGGDGASVSSVASSSSPPPVMGDLGGSSHRQGGVGILGPIADPPSTQVHTATPLPNRRLAGLSKQILNASLPYS